MDEIRKHSEGQEKQIHELIDANTALKVELQKERENQKYYHEQELKRQSEYEAMVSQMKNLNTKAVKELAQLKSREGSLSVSISSSLSITDQILHATQSVMSDIQLLEANGVYQVRNAQWNVQNIKGAVNFAKERLTELSRQLNGGVGVISENDQ